MLLVALFIGAILIVSAIRNSQGALFTALYEDVPGFVTWAAAILAIGAVGFVPGLKPISRGLLALIIVVLVLRNYQGIIGGFQSAWKNPPAATPQKQPGANVQGTSGMTNSIGIQPGPHFGDTGLMLDPSQMGDFSTSAGSLF